jgi:hypothetical protein
MAVKAEVTKRPGADVQEMRMREQFEAVMAEGLPTSLVILADIPDEDGKGKVRCAMVGGIPDLLALLQVGLAQGGQMLAHATSDLKAKGPLN